MSKQKPKLNDRAEQIKKQINSISQKEYLNLLLIRFEQLGKLFQGLLQTVNVQTDMLWHMLSPEDRKKFVSKESPKDPSKPQTKEEIEKILELAKKSRMEKKKDEIIVSIPNGEESK